MYGILCKLAEVQGDLVCAVATGTGDLGREGRIGYGVGLYFKILTKH